MKMKESYNLLIKEYIDKCDCCDECIAEFYCIENDLRTYRSPVEKNKCHENLKEYLRSR